MQPEVKWIMEYLDDHDMLDEMQNTIDALFKWSCQDHGYKSKNARIKEWNVSTTDYYDILCYIFAGVILHPEGMTYQAMIGYISGNIDCADPLDRAKCAAEVIAIAYQCELIVITKVSDKTMMITTEFKLGDGIPEFEKHMPEFKKPQPVMFNPILGNQFKQHDSDVCIDHINKMNVIPLTLDQRIIASLPETTTAELETPEQIEQWEAFVCESALAYNKVAEQGHRFFLTHNNDTRGRCYCDGYYINYQGASYKKAIVQLADKEIVKL